MNNICKERLVREGTPYFATSERNYKDTLFRMVFREPEALLQLYNAVNGTQYTNPEDLEIVTLENAIYMSMKNDLAFIIGCYLNMYEQQSTFNPNMPLRFLQYVSREYEKLIVGKTIYSSKQVKLPTPKFIVFYNGRETMPERMVLKLSESFEIHTEAPELELQVTQLNINEGCNRKLMDQCKTLREYAQYVERVRRYTEKRPLQQAVEQAVQECIEEGILAAFLTRYRAEAIAMSIFEYDEERERALIRQADKEVAYEEGLAEGLAAGRAEGHAEGLAAGRAEGHAEGLAAGRAEGHAEGRAEGLAAGIRVFVLDNIEENVPRERIIQKLVTRYSLTEEQALDFIHEVSEKMERTP